MLRQMTIRNSLLVALFGAIGCNQNPYVAAQTPPLRQPQPQQQVQLQDLGRRATALDADNRDLHATIAKAEQQKRVLQTEVKLLRRQLADTVSQLTELHDAKEETERRMATVEASARIRGGATITANNSLRSELPQVTIPGIDVRRDGDLLRIQMPSDRLFQYGTARLLPTAAQLIDQVGQVVGRAYRQQMIGIEGHTDAMSSGAASSHKLTADQSVAVLEALIRHGRFSTQQLFQVGYGANKLLVSNATPSGRAKNRRIEVVIYPERIDVR
jgi:flagellar motor protein MotB